MIWAIKSILHNIVGIFLYIERTYQDIVRTGKNSAISILGPISTVILVLATPITISDTLKIPVMPVVVLVVGAGLILLVLLLLIGAWRLWEFFRYDIDSRANPLFYKKKW
jgi:uncharacterized membrane protein YdbT with pleckstrin-like domain